MNRWTRDEAVRLRDQLLAGVTKEELSSRYGVQWQTLYKAMNLHNVYPYAMPRISVVQLRALYHQFVGNPKVRIRDLAATLGLTTNALRSRWLRLGLKSLNRKQVFPDRKLPWNLGLTIWTMRSQGKSTKQICEAIGRTYDGDKSCRYVRHHLLRWCYDTHTKVPSIEPGKRNVKWLSPPTEPPT